MSIGVMGKKPEKTAFFQSHSIEPRAFLLQMHAFDLSINVVEIHFTIKITF